MAIQFNQCTNKILTMAISLLLNTIMATLAVLLRLWDIVTPSPSSIKQQLPPTPIIAVAETTNHQKQQPFPTPDRPRNVRFFSISKTNVSKQLWQN